MCQYMLSFRLAGSPSSCSWSGQFLNSIKSSCLSAVNHPIFLSPLLCPKKSLVHIRRPLIKQTLFSKPPSLVFYSKVFYLSSLWLLRIRCSLYDRFYSLNFSPFSKLQCYPRLSFRHPYKKTLHIKQFTSLFSFPNSLCCKKVTCFN